MSKNLLKQLNMLLFLFVLSITTLPSLSYAFQQSTFKNTGNIYSIVQDQKGFIWLAGQNGLFRYDGEQAINFSNKDNGWSIPFNWINDISVHEEHLLLSTETDGLWKFNTETATNQRIELPAEINTFYRSILHKGSYYAISMTPQNLYRYDIKTKSTTLIAEDIDNYHLFSSEDRVYFDDKKKLQYIDTSTNNYKINSIESINTEINTANSINNMLLVTDDSHMYLLKDNGKLIKKKIEHPINLITPHDNQHIFYAVDVTGKISKRESKTLHIIKSNFPTVQKARYQTLLHDNSDVLWLGDNIGIQQLTEARIKNHSVSFKTRFNYMEAEVYQEEIYIGTSGKGVHTFLLSDQNELSPVETINRALSNRAMITGDLLTIGEELFIATFDGLWVYNKNTEQVTKLNLTYNEQNLSNLVLLKLRKSKNLLYIATDGSGLIIYDLNKQITVEHLNKNIGLSSGEVIDILPLTEYKLWIATATGIDEVNRQTKQVKNITKQSSTKFISLLKVDNKIFSSTKGKGIQVYNRQGELLAQLAKGVNFSQMVYSDDKIIASAKPGLYIISPDNYQYSMVTNTGKYTFTDNAFTFKKSLYIPNSTGILQLPRNHKKVFHPKIYISKTTVSGKSYLLNKLIEVDSGNDVITLDLASLDYRPGIKKNYAYTFDGNEWHQISGNQLTLTGLASGEYNIEIMATNSLGQWSDFKAFTNIKVAYPWYWSPQIRLLYTVFLISLTSLIAWLLYLRSKSIAHIHNTLKNDLNNQGKINSQLNRNLTLANDLLTQGDISQSKTLLTQCITELSNQHASTEPNTLDGQTLSVAIPFFANYLQHKYQVNLTAQLNINDETLSYELQADIYRVTFEAITYVVLKGSGRNFKVNLQIFKNKIWLNLYDDEQGFANFDSKINFDISMYYIRQIANKHKGSINAFNDQSDGSQLVLSLPLP